MATDLVVYAPPDSRVDRARALLSSARARTRGSLVRLERELKAEVATRLDWRTSYRSHPEWFVGAALMVGFFVGYRR